MSVSSEYINKKNLFVYNVFLFIFLSFSFNCQLKNLRTNSFCKLCNLKLVYVDSHCLTITRRIFNKLKFKCMYSIDIYSLINSLFLLKVIPTKSKKDRKTLTFMHQFILKRYKMNVFEAILWKRKIKMYVFFFFFLSFCSLLSFQLTKNKTTIIYFLDFFFDWM